MASIDERLLEDKMMQIEQARPWSLHPISMFETLIRNADEVSVHRASTVAFGRDRWSIFVLVALVSFACNQAAIAQAWPTRTVTLVVPYSAGGSQDAVARGADAG